MCPNWRKSIFHRTRFFSNLYLNFARLMGKLSKLRITHHDISLLFHLCKAVGSKSIERLRYPGFGVQVRKCHLVLLMSVIRSYFFCFLAIDNDIMRKKCTLITSKGTDIDENIANQNHATRTRTPKPGYLNLSNMGGGRLGAQE
jgi:hypothetical protein